jgi:hypothetical protein
MRRIIISCVLMGVAFSGLAQKNKWSFKDSKYAKPSRDNAMIQIGYETWLNVPDTIRITGIGRAFNAYLTYDFPIQKSNFSFAAGIGIASSNIYFSNQEVLFNDSANVRFITETTNYKKYKLGMAYIEAPFELRYFSDMTNRNKGIKAAIGLKVGSLVSAHTKGKQSIYNKPSTDKTSSKRFLESYRYSLTARIGYGNFSLYANYGLSNVFKLNQGPENIKPVQIGICISGL